MDGHELNELLPLHADRLPLRVDEGGAVRVGKSRISLDLVVEQYENGMSPEDEPQEDDTLTDELLASNSKFQALVEKSKESAQTVCPGGSGAWLYRVEVSQSIFPDSESSGHG